MDMQQAKKALMDLQTKLSAYDHALSLLNYDGDTGAPRGTAANRAQTQGVLTEILYTLSTGKDTVDLLEYLDARKEELSEREKRMVYLLLKDIRFMQKIPMDEYIAYEKLVVESQSVWHEAKLNSDFASFRPYLEKMFETAARFARYADPDKDPYDYWLNEYETGLNREKCDAFFARLRERLVPLIRRCGQQPPVSDDCLHGDFPEDRQEEIHKPLTSSNHISLPE